MSNKFLHIIHTALAGKEGDRKKHKFPSWLPERIELFKFYCLKSLLNQTNKEFLHWISFSLEEKDSEEIQKLREYLESINYNYIFTFFGLPYLDTHGSNIGKFKKDNIIVHKLEDRIKFSLEILGERLERSLPVYLTTIDSDDLFHKGAVVEIQSQPFKAGSALVFPNGYIFDNRKNLLSEWCPGKNTPPFYTLLYNPDIFWNAEKHTEFIKKIEVHRLVSRFYPFVNLSYGKFLVLFHGNNDTTRWTNSARQKKIIKDPEAKEILKDFGICLK